MTGPTASRKELPSVKLPPSGGRRNGRLINCTAVDGDWIQPDTYGEFLRLTIKNDGGLGVVILKWDDAVNLISDMLSLMAAQRAEAENAKG